MKNNANHLLEKLNQFEKQGYTDQLRFENGKMLNCTTRKYYTPNDIKMFDEKRFEGMTNPSDMSILFVIEFKDGHKGTLAAPYGAQADAELFEFMSQAEKSIQA